MASAEKRAKHTWTVRWRDVDGTNAQASGFATKQEALIYGREQEAMVRKGKRTKPSEMNLTVHQFISQVWAATLRVRAATRADYERSLNSHILPAFGNTLMRDIKPADLEAWVSHMENVVGLSPRTAEKHRNLLAAILKKAFLNEYIHKNPFVGLRWGRAKKINKVRPLTRSQVNAVANSLPEMYRIMVWVGFYTGMRPSEIMGLTWSQLDFVNSKIVIDRQLSRDTSKVHEDKLKTEASERTIQFSKILQQLIHEHVSRFGLGPHGLILQNRTGGILRYKDASRLFRMAGRKHGLLPGEGLHQLRHTCVSTLIELNANPKAVQEWVGHASIVETLDTYGHLFPNSMSDLADKLDAYGVEDESFRTVDISIAN